MGNCCAKIFGYRNVYNTSNDQQNSLEIIQYSNEREVSLVEEDSSYQIQNSTLKDLFTDKDIENLQKIFLEQLKSQDKNEFEKIEPNLKNLSIENASFYVKFQQQENSSNYDNLAIQEFDVQYTPEQVLLFLIHFEGSLSKHTDINEFLANDYDTEQQILRRLNYYKSKKVLMMSPRHLLDIELIKKYQQGYMILSQSVTENDLIKDKAINKKLNDIDQDCLLVTKVAGYILQKSDKGCLITIYKNVDSKSSIGLRMAKGTLKTNFNNYLKLFEKEIKNFLENQNFQDLEKYMTNNQIQNIKNYLFNFLFTVIKGFIFWPYQQQLKIITKQ